MKLTKLLGGISIALAPLTGLGLYLENFDYWLGFDIVTMILFPIFGYFLIKKNLHK